MLHYRGFFCLVGSLVLVQSFVSQSTVTIAMRSSVRYGMDGIYKVGMHVRLELDATDYADAFECKTHNKFHARSRSE